MSCGVLVVGYGNVLRTDDGVGWHVAERLATDPRTAGTTVIRCHQLTPELALDLSRVATAVFVDARRGPPVGAFTIERLADTAAGGVTWSHQQSPSSLVALARELYGQAPEVLLVGVGVESVAVGEGLSPVVEAAVPRLVDAVVELVAGLPAHSGAVAVVGYGHA